MSVGDGLPSMPPTPGPTEPNRQQCSGKAKGRDPGRAKAGTGLEQSVQLSEGFLAGRGLTQWPLSFPQDAASPSRPSPPSGFPGGAPHTPFSSAGPSAAGPGPARQPPRPRAHSRTACRVGDLRSVAGEQGGRGVRQGGRWGGLAARDGGLPRRCQKGQDGVLVWPPQRLRSTGSPFHS